MPPNAMGKKKGGMVLAISTCQGPTKLPNTARDIGETVTVGVAVGVEVTELL